MLPLLVTILVFSSGLAAEEDPDTYMQEPCSEEENRLPEEVYSPESAEVIFVSGGIGYCESQAMQSASKEYPLELVFVQKTASGENYLANIPLQITDTKGNLVLDTVTKGPYLLARMPAGRYTIAANHNGEIKTQRVTLAKKHQRLVFAWVRDY
ncbi:MAG: hypothetical protein CVU15_09865 [Betaproteobacteria bacterium HGW-Betaproteobacteria-1]|jgi:hypothetical protein|nr:MAG: hypothetical protein CVU15_09865 [Betaproteobacteria bacterium HGW-Betaproteobacteria-1]